MTAVTAGAYYARGGGQSRVRIAPGRAGQTTPCRGTPAGVLCRRRIFQEGRTTSERYIGFFRLLEACRARGCPVCRRVRDESRRHLGALLYEQVTDSDTRRDLRASWGFCNRHTWMLLEVGDAAFGASILHEDLLRLVLRRIEYLGNERPRARPRPWWPWHAGGRRLPRIVERYRRRRPCLVCVSAASTERLCLRALVALDAEPDLQLAYAGSDGLCLPHVMAAIETAPGTPGLRELLERTSRTWSRLREDLQGFVRKHDHRHREAFSEAETTSYLRAFEALAGARGALDDDRHRRDQTRPSPRADGEPPDRSSVREDQDAGIDHRPDRPAPDPTVRSSSTGDAPDGRTD